MKCPNCNKEMSKAEYLDGEAGFETAYVCMNDDCDNVVFYDEKGNLVSA